MLDLHVPVIHEALRLQQAIDALKQRRVGFELPVGGAHDALAGPADRHDVQAKPLRLREGPRVEREGALRVRFGNHAGATAR